MSYEFNDTEAEQMWIFGNRIAIVSIILGTSAIIGIITSIIKIINNTDVTRSIILMLDFIAMLFIAIFLFLPSDNFKEIAVSEGRDIQELMRGLQEFRTAFLITAGVVIFSGILSFILILHKI